jgi:xylulokinase
MAANAYVITYDIGTTGIKTCIFEISDRIKLLESSMVENELEILDNGGAEQNPDEWWQGLAETTVDVLKKSGLTADQIRGISFCSQMQGLVLVNDKAEAIRPAMSYMDQRARQEKKETVGHGLRIQEFNILKLLKSLNITGAAPASVKDPLWKYKWVQKNEPEVFSQCHKWLDVKEYLIARSTGRYIMTEDSAFATFLYDSRKGKKRWSSSLCRMYGVDINHLPEVIRSSDLVGTLNSIAAAELGLTTDCLVFGGGGDATLIGVGAGSVAMGDTHIYSGTSGWVSTVVDNRNSDLSHMIGSVIGAEEGRFNYFGELETSGKSLEWVKNHLALDEIDIYLKKQKVTEGTEAECMSLYDHMCESIKDTPSGSGGVIFTPWLHGNRCPFEDSNARGIFFNISLDTGKRKLIRAVLEGIAYHTRWMLEASMGNISVSDTIRFVGGGALSPLTCQIMADVTGHTIETVESSQNVGSVGAAVCCGIGLGNIRDFDSVKKFIPVKQSYDPEPDAKSVHDRNYMVFKRLYKNNKRNFKILNQI